VECGILSGLRFERPVLDLGCGDGLFAATLFEDRVDHGIDISPREIALARKSGKYHHLEVARAGSLPFYDNYFRAIFSNCVIEHLDELGECFREARRVLKPGGKFYCTTHSDHYEDYFLYSTILKKLGFEGLAARYSGIWKNLWEHSNCFPADEWISRLKKAGFAEAKATPYFSRRAVYIFDLFLPFAAPSYYVRKLTGRWKVFPRNLTLIPAKQFLKRISRNVKDGDWCYLLEAVK
jgi:ubiquinone/menaquinone biosynthesis C-methylase UbiE